MFKSIAAALAVPACLVAANLATAENGVSAQILAQASGGSGFSTGSGGMGASSGTGSSKSPGGTPTEGSSGASGGSGQSKGEASGSMGSPAERCAAIADAGERQRCLDGARAK